MPTDEPLPSLSRREFLAASGVALAGAALLPATDAAAGSPGAPLTPDAFFDRPLRWMQLTLVDSDPGQMNMQFWLDYFRRCHAEAACLNAGGCVAFYPTQIPFHHRSAWMKPGEDPFGFLVRGCRKMDMTVVARVDPHSALDDAAQAHPEWIAIEANGKPHRHWAAPDRWVTCANGPYNFEFMTNVIREIVGVYQVDGVFANRWQGHGPCYCAFCREHFKQASGLDLPRAGDANEAKARRQWAAWRHERMLELWRLWDAEIRKLVPHGAFIANAGGGAFSEFDMIEIGKMSPIFAADRQSRDARVVPPWINGRNAKEYRGAVGLKPVGGIFSVGRDDQYRWKDSVQNGPELRLWAAEGIANGMRPWVCKFSGTLYDERWLPVVAEIYQWHWKHERYLRNVENLARVAVVYSQQTARHYGQENGAQKVEAHDLGFQQALIEARVPFEMLHDQWLDAPHADRFKLLILPNIACLSDAQCDQLRAFVQRGGSLLAAFETSLYDEHGRRRPNFGLSDLFGARFTGTVETFIKNSYIRIEAETHHPILAGLEDAGRIINTTQRVGVETTAPFTRPPLTRVPSYPDLPMEEVYPRPAKTDVPEVYLREYGHGRVVYFPGDLGRTFWEVFDADHAKLLASAIRWAANEDPLVTVTGPGVSTSPSGASATPSPSTS